MGRLSRRAAANSWLSQASRWGCDQAARLARLAVVVSRAAATGNGMTAAVETRGAVRTSTRGPLLPLILVRLAPRRSLGTGGSPWKRLLVPAGLRPNGTLSRATDAIRRASRNGSWRWRHASTATAGVVPGTSRAGSMPVFSIPSARPTMRPRLPSSLPSKPMTLITAPRRCRAVAPRPRSLSHAGILVGHR